MEVRIEGNRLTIGSIVVELEVKVVEVDKFQDLFFVLLDDEDYDQDDPNAERNIVALDAAGNIVWRIQHAPSAPIVRGKRQFNPYIGIDPQPERRDRLVEAYDGSGLCWKVNPETGDVSEPIFTK